MGNREEWGSGGDCLSGGSGEVIGTESKIFFSMPLSKLSLSPIPFFKLKENCKNNCRVTSLASVTICDFPKCLGQLAN